MDPGNSEEGLEKADVKLPFYFVIIRVILPGEPDRRTQFLQHFEILIKASFGNTHLPGKFRRGSRRFPPDKLVELLQ